MAGTIRLLTASDLLLGRPLRGLTQWPDEFFDELVEAPYEAAQRVFSAAAERAAHLLVLTGDVLEPRGTSPRAIRFLFDQCRRVQKQNVDVYWLEGKHDRWDEWPSGLPIPENLHRISRHASQPTVWKRGALPTVKLINLATHRGSSASSISSEETFEIGLTQEGSQPPKLDDHELDLVIMAGRSSFLESEVSGVPVVSAGMHQPRSPGQSGPGVAVEFQLRADNVIWQPLPVATVKFLEEKVRFESAPKLEAIRERLGDKALDMVASAEDAVVIVRWIVDIPAGDFPELDLADLEQKTLVWLRKEFCSSSSKVWSYRVEFRADGPAPTSWREEDSILGDFLRGWQEMQENDEDLQFGEMSQIDQRVVRELLESPVAGREREKLLDRVREVGLQMLRGEESTL